MYIYKKDAFIDADSDLRGIKGSIIHHRGSYNHTRHEGNGEYTKIGSHRYQRRNCPTEWKETAQ